MVPPEDLGMELPDFDNMTPEEQMEWLESLARRQGVNADELTTAADFDIAVPENAVIDEPGYVPFFERERGARAGATDAHAAEDALPVEEEEPEEAGEPDFVVAEQPEAILDDIFAATEEPSEEAVLEGADPMTWLDSFTPHAEAEFGDLELDFSAEDEDLGELEELGWALSEAEVPEAPMADLVESVEPIQEPAPSIEAEAPTAEEEFRAAEAFELGAFLGDSEGPGPQAEAVAEDELLDGMDPMLWLESLAVRQGASQEELTTSANLEIPEVPEGTVVDEPGYVPFDVTDGTREPESILNLSTGTESLPEERPDDAGQDADIPSDVFEWQPSPGQDEISVASQGEAEAPLGWLEDLASEPDEQDFAQIAGLEHDYLGIEDSADTASGEAFPAQPEESVEDPLAGLTDDMIAELQSHGELTGEQELAWLQRQAEKLAETRQLESAANPDEVEPAEPGEIPEWLAEMRSEPEEAPVPEPDMLADELFELETFDEMPDWLVQPEGAPPGTEAELAPDLRGLWGEEADVQAVLEVPLEPSEGEIEAFVQEQYEAEPDDLAEALDAEFERRVAGDTSEPEWYTDALAQTGDDDTVPAEAGAEPELQQAVPVELPEWLRENMGESKGVSEPDWLSQPAPVAALEASPVADVAEPVAIPAARRAEPIPDDPLFDEYRERLEQDAADHATRLSLARALQSSGAVSASLEHYDVLVQSNELLQDVADDLEDLAQQEVANPRVHRVRGDAYVRRGLLQQALDAYRAALELL